MVQQPGESYHYGLNIAVLGLVIERIMDKNLDDIFEERVVKKLGLTGLQYTAPKDVELIPISGDRKIFGFNKKVMGQLK